MLDIDMSPARDHSESEKAAAREVRERLRELQALANSAQLGMLGYLLRLAIVEATAVVSDEEAAAD